MTRTDGRPRRRREPSRPAGFGRRSGPILATLHGVLAMFFFAAAWTKLTEPLDLLSLMMTWPAETTAEVVRAVGWIEFMLAAAVVAPLVRDRHGRIAALAATLALSGNAAFMTTYYIVQRDPGLMTTNLLLILICAAIWVGHRRPRTRSGLGP
ncbi:MAG: DoxX family protein [Alphaproteobacteria bacterium]|nr:DoxX family protein [Alphaproteobacteria bacterium]MBU2269830.1 DoxX family protein [Alphaproteobacteria bacterium]MBU2419970.1 DoxX family protein [Alphaproteobacteria bacterium]